MPVQKAAHSSCEIVFRHFENVVENWRRDWIRDLSCSRSQILAVMCVNVDVKNILILSFI